MSDSLFDIVGPVMIGPSSSHTAGAVKLGQLARNIVLNPMLNVGNPEPPKIKSVEFVLYNSFAKTYQGHGTDRGLLAGILGLDVYDDGIRDAFTLADKEMLNYTITPYDKANTFLPNTVVFKITTLDEQEFSITGHSIGGGKVYLSKINRYDVQINGELPTLVLFYKDKPGMIWKVTKVLAEKEINIATLDCSRLERGVDAFMTITMDSMPDVEDIREIRDVHEMHRAIAIPAF